MSENDSWTPPAGPSSTDSPSPERESLTPGPADVGGNAPRAPHTGWAPSPKPGLIPLRPLSFGTMLSASLQVMRRNPRPTFGISLLLNGLVSVIFGLVVGFLAFGALGRISSANLAQQEEIIAGSVGTVLLSSLIPLCLSIAITAILQGIIALEVAQGTIGEKLSLAGLWRLARGRLWALIGWSFAVTAVLLFVIVIVVLAVIVIAAVGGLAGAIVAVIVGIGAFLVFVVGSAWLGTKLSLVPSVLMIERTSLPTAIARSWRLTTGFFWKTLGIQLLINVIVQAAAQVVTVPISIIVTLGGGLLNPNGTADVVSAAAIVGVVLSGIVGAIVGAISIVMQSAAIALIYLDIRMRRKGLDLELVTFVEARQHGDESVRSPFVI